MKDPKKLAKKVKQLKVELAAAEKKHRAGAKAFAAKRAAWSKVNKARTASGLKIQSLHYRLADTRWKLLRAIEAEKRAVEAKAKAKAEAKALKAQAAAAPVAPAIEPSPAARGVVTQ